MSLRQSSWASCSSGGFFAPLRMVVPEFFAHVRQFDPGVDQNAVAMAGFDQELQVLVAFRVGIVEMPRGHMQGSDAGLAPAGGEVIGIGARSIRVIEEGPEVRTANRRARIRDPSAPASGKGSARSRAGPGDAATHNTAPAPIALACDQRRARPAIFRENARCRRAPRNAEVRSPSPDDRQRGVVDIDQMNHRDRFGLARDNRNSRRAATSLRGSAPRLSRPCFSIRRRRECSAARQRCRRTETGTEMWPADERIDGPWAGLRSQYSEGPGGAAGRRCEARRARSGEAIS